MALRLRWAAVVRVVGLLLAMAAFITCAPVSRQRAGRWRVVRPAEHPPLRGSWRLISADQTDLAALARSLGVPIEDIEELNGIDRSEPLQIGQKIFVPQPSASDRAAAGAQARRRTRQGSAAAVGKARCPRLAWPVSGGTISSGFGKRRGKIHEGIDIAAPHGTPVLAAAPGRVLYVGSGLRGYGKLVLLRHARNYVTVYAHNSRLLVREGQRVNAGEVIAEVGRTGRATADHLHFELRRGETPIDPRPCLPPSR